MRTKKYILFVVFHNTLKIEYYEKSLLDNYVFVNVNPNNLYCSKYPSFHIVNQYELANFKSLGKWYTESEVIYNVYKNVDICKDVDYVGFLQYDIDSSPLTKEIIDEILENHNHINFEPHLFQKDYAQNVLMDLRKPNTLTGRGTNCYDTIIDDYNKFYGTFFTRERLYDKEINLCSSFMLSKDLFNEMMQFISSIVESGKLDLFDTEHRYRIQGGFLERYYAVWLALKETHQYIFKLEHQYEQSVSQNKSWKSEVKRLIKEYVKWQ